MSREILEAVREIEKEKGIEDDTLVRALEDALLAAYKKTPGAARHAHVELDRVSGDFRVWSIELPADVEERLLDEARERALTELEAAEAENGERSHTLLSDDDLTIDWSDVPEDQVKRTDVTPENFGRIAAQTAKQVILQRIREAEREMMYDEYVDRVSEVVTGIVQQAGDRNNVLVDLGKVEALLPRSEQVDGERYEQGSRIKAVITEVRSGTKGPQVILSRRDPGADQDALRARGARDRRRPRRDSWRGARARLPLEDRRRVPRPGRRPGRRLRRPARLSRPHGRVRAPRREDRHHPVESRAREVRRQGALAGPCPRGARGRRDDGGDRGRPRRPALARHRQGRAQRPSRRPADGLEDRHRLGVRVRAHRGRGGLRRRGRRGVLRPLRRGALQRQALPEHLGTRLALLRNPRPPRARSPRGGREELDPSEAVPVGGMPEEPAEVGADGEVPADGDDTAEPQDEAANAAPEEEEQPAS